MYARLQEELLDHEKIAIAGRAIGKNGRCLAIGFYTMVLIWSNRHLTDGVIPIDVIEGFRGTYVVDPLAIADALARAGLFDKHVRGYSIHDYRDWNPSAAEIKKKRREDRQRKAQSRANGHA
jgi:hypothetical protein